MTSFEVEYYSAKGKSIFYIQTDWMHDRDLDNYCQDQMELIDGAVSYRVFPVAYTAA